MRTVTVHEAKTHLSRLLKAVEAGETIIVARGSTPIARLEPWAERERQFDTAPDLIVTMDDSFNDPLEDFEPYMAAEEPE